MKAGADPRPDVVVVGGGPAGSTTALLLARRGWRVVLVDRVRFPRAKACGEFLSPGVVRALERMELGAGDLSAAGVVRGWCLDLDGTAVSVDFGPGDAGMSLPRAAFDHHLLTLARRGGVRVLEETTYVPAPRTGSTGPGGPVVVRDGAGTHTLRPRFLVGAGGLRCPVAAELGLARRGRGLPKVSLTGRVTGLDLPMDRGRLILRGDLTVGVAPSDRAGRLWNATVVVPAAAHSRALADEGPAAFYQRCLALAGLDTARRVGASEALLASGPFDRPARPLFRGNAVLVGDAAGYFDPFTGQGLYQALRSAELLTPLLHRALRGSLSPTRGFQRYQQFVEGERRSTRALQIQVDRALGSRSGRAVAARALTRVPSLLAAIMKATTDRRTPGSALAGWLRHTLSSERRGATESMTITASRTAT